MDEHEFHCIKTGPANNAELCENTFHSIKTEYSSDVSIRELHNRTKAFEAAMRLDANSTVYCPDSVLCLQMTPQ
jgi:hypothetical protein